MAEKQKLYCLRIKNEAKHVNIDSYATNLPRIIMLTCYSFGLTNDTIVGAKRE
jgi:hypothetical protein